jgi:hypothetical protein
MKVTKDLLKEMLPEIVNLLENIQDSKWTEEILKKKLIEYIKSK